MVKESMFSIIQFDIEGRSVLDLFSGCGQLGIEAVSRGAKEAVFVDKSKQSAAVTLENIKSVGFEDKCKVYNKDYAAFLSGCSQKFDIIFLDPPYALDIGKTALKKIADRGLLNQDGVVVYERDVPFTGEVMGLRAYDERRYGKAYLTFFARGNEDEN